MPIDLEHPVVTAIRRYGYPEPEPRLIGEDFFGNPIHEGDEIYVLDEYVFLDAELGYQAAQILEALGAKRKTA